MRQVFRLASVLRVRRVQEERALADMRRARDEARAARLEAERAEARVDEVAVPHGVQPSSWRAVTAGRLGLAGDAVLARAASRDADQALDAAALRWHDSRVARRGVERLEERHAEQARLDDERAAQRDLDDRAHPASGTPTRTTTPTSTTTTTTTEGGAR